MTTGIVRGALGIHTDLSIDSYHDGPGISKTGLEHIARSPAHYQEARKRKRAEEEKSEALIVGDMVHAMVLEPWRVEQKFIIELETAPYVRLERRKNVDKETWAQFRAEHAGKGIVSRKHYDAAKTIAEVIQAHPVASVLLSPDDEGPVEGTAYWIDPRTRRLCKCRPDKTPSRIHAHADLKTAADASFDAFGRQAANLSYFLSDAMTGEGWKIASGEDEARPYIFVVVEKVPPYGIGIYQLDEPSRRLGMETYRKLMDVYSECVEHGDWPSYPTHIRTLQLPGWAFYDRRS